MDRKFFNKIKEYGPFTFIVISAGIAACISYGSSQAAISLKLDNVDARFQVDEKDIDKLKLDNEQTGKDIASMKTKIDDIWRDMGHHE